MCFRSFSEMPVLIGQTDDKKSHLLLSRQLFYLKAIGQMQRPLSPLARSRPTRREAETLRMDGKYVKRCILLSKESMLYAYYMYICQ